MSEPNFIDMRPAPGLVRQALEHAGIPLTYTDDHTAVVPEGEDMEKLLAAVITAAMVSHVEETMVLPSNVARIRAQANVLADIAEYGALDPEDKEAIEEVRNTLQGVADNLDPAKRKEA